jgi:hypothetical protein
MSKLPTLRPSLLDYLVEQKRGAKRQANSSAFARSGTVVSAEGVVTVDGELDVAGTLNVTGNTVIGGTLSLPNGIVDNAALTSPVVQDVASASATGFGLTFAWAERAGVNIVVPAGCTQLLAVVAGWMFSYNPNTTGGSDGAGGDSLQIICKLGSQSSKYFPVGLSGNGGYTSVSSGDSFIFPGLTPGSTLRLSASCATGYQSIAADVANKVTITAALSWLR